MRGNPTTGTEVRTPGTIIARLAKSMGAMNLRADPYLDCRLGCIANIRDPPTIPDGNGGKCLASCSYSSDRITISSGTGPQTFQVSFAPFFPFAGYVRNPSPANLTLSVNGVPHSNAYAMPIGIDPAVATLSYTATTPGSPAVDPYNAASVRIVSRTAKITYTGPVTTCAGVLRCFENPISVSNGTETTSTSSTTTAPTTGTFCQIVNTTSNSATRFTPINTSVDNLDTTVTTVVPMNSMTMRPEQGCTLMMRHKTNKYEHIPVGNTVRGITVARQVIPIAGTISNIANEFAEYSSASVGYGGGYMVFDNDWIAQTVQFENVNPDASFLIETMCCYEWTTQAGSPFRAFEKASAPHKPAIMNAVNKALDEGAFRPNSM